MAKIKLLEKEFEVALHIGDTVEEAIELVGAEKVMELYKESAERHGAAVAKRFMRKDYSEERVNEEMKTWTPASAKVKIVDKVAKAQKMWEGLSEAEKELFKAAL